jgi:hypothetical protein
MRNISFARSDEAMLDLDSDRSYRLFLKRLPVILPLILKMVVVATRPHHFHVYIKLKRRHRFVDISALQIYLGSDPRRELANLSRIVAGASKPILLIEYTKVNHWRKPDIVCSCPPKWKGRKLGNCRHLMAARGHKAKYGFLSTRLKILGVKDPYGHT